MIGVVVHDGQVLLDVGPPGDPLVVAVRLDHHLARRLTARLWRVHWLRLDLEQGTGDLFASTRRPVRVRLPLAAALALVEDGVPTLVTA